MLDDLSHVGTAVARHPLLDGAVVPPEVGDGLDGSAASVVGPVCARIEAFDPGCQGAPIGGARENPGALGGALLPSGSKGSFTLRAK